MAEQNNLGKLGPVTFKTVYEEDKKFFYTLRDKVGNTLHDTFNLLVNSYKELNNLKPEIANNINHVEVASLQKKIADDSTKIMELEMNLEEFKAKIIELENELKNCKEAKPIETIVEPKSPAFVFTPNESTAKNMKRLYALKIKQGKVDKNQSGLTTFLNLYTEKAINYFIKDNYSEILK
jgi:predicted RNase H-like nuclease (RuvC/YqgF family)